MDRTLVERLEAIRDVIHGAPIDCLGSAHDPETGPAWPIRDEVVDGLTKCINELREVEPDAYCINTEDGGCVSADPRCMHNWPAAALRATTGEGEWAAERAAAALGHFQKVSDTCTAQVKPTPPEQRPPGPSNPPIFCCLKAGHEGPHRCNGGGMYPSIPFRATDDVEFREPVTVCAKCRTRWPCPDAATLIEAFAAALRATTGEGEALLRDAVLDKATLRQAIHAMKRCKAEANGTEWDKYIAKVEAALTAAREVKS